MSPKPQTKRKTRVNMEPKFTAWKGPVRVAAVQFDMGAVSSFAEFAQRCEFFVKSAADYQTDFVLFPELLTNPLLALVQESRPTQSARRLTEFTPAYVETFTRFATQYHINIIAGSHLTVEENRLYNVAYLFRRDGSVAQQKKIHITPSEKKAWGVEPGKLIEVFDTDRGRIALVICYDIEFPELTRIAVAKGANLLFVPFNTDLRSGYLRVRYCAQARCVENNVYCVLSGACGNLPQVIGADIHYAQSCILTPSDIPFARDGIAAEATANSETMIVHDVDLGLTESTRTNGSVRTWVDRRKDVYRVTYLSDGKAQQV